MPFGVGQWELMILGAIFVLFFGSARLPRIGRDLGRSLRDLRKTLDGVDPRAQLDQPGSGERPATPPPERDGSPPA